MVVRNFTDVSSIDHTYRLRIGLEPQDYCQVAASVLDGGLFAAGTSGKLALLQSSNALGQHQNLYSPTPGNSRNVSGVFGRICYIVEKFRQTDLLPEVAEFLEYDDHTVQSHALWVLGRLEAKDYIKQIGTLGASPDWGVSWSVLQILVKSNSKEAVPGLILYLKKGNFSMQRRAVEALGDIGDRSAVPHLIALLDTKLVAQAMGALVKIGDKSVVTHIIPMLDTPMSVWALHGLVGLDAQEALPHIKKLYDPDGPNANVLLTSLAYFGDEQAISDIVVELADKATPRGKKLMETLVGINARPAIPALISVLDEKAVGAHTKMNGNTTRDIMFGLAKLQANQAIPVLLRYLEPQNKNSFLMDEAIEALGRLKAKQAIPELLLTLDSRDHSTWASATLALARMAEPSATERVIAELRTGKPHWRHSEVMAHLAFASNPDTHEALLAAKPFQLESAHIEGYLKELTEKCGVKITLSENLRLSEKDKRRIVAGLNSGSGLPALDRAVRFLNDSRYNNTFFIDRGVVKLMTLEEAYSLWDKWVAEYQQENPD